MLQIVKKQEMSPRNAAILRVSMVFAALIAAGVIILILGYNPITVYSKMIEGALTNKYRLTQTINKAIPLVILSLGVAVAFKMKFWNIGAEGQLYMGAIGASYIALFHSDLPIYIMLPLMMLAGILCGGIWALIPAVLKSSLGTNETLVTLMMNYVAQKFVNYLQIGPWKDPKAFGFPKIATFTDNAVLPKVFGIHIGWIIALILVVVVHILLKHSKLGYEISVLGENPQTARYAGMSIPKILLVSVLISGGLCGLVGMMQASGIEKTLNEGISGGLGFTAIITAYLAQLSAPVILVVSFLFAVLLQGGTFLQVALEIPASVAEVVQGVILFFVLASEFFTNYKIVIRHRESADAGKEAAE
ncbi:MAG: ABC transporter permease [Clostridia bacterium]|nr:ABC transporter permease [Clostridia bacterium]